MEEPRLRPCVRFDLERIRVLPADMKPSGDAHDRRRPEGLALISARVIFREIPLARGLHACRVQWHAGEIALRRRDHSPQPVLGDDRHPVTGEIHAGAGLTGRRRAAAALGAERHACRQHQRNGNEKPG